jgi:hypothetical protein
MHRLIWLPSSSVRMEMRTLGCDMAKAGSADEAGPGAVEVEAVAGAGPEREGPDAALEGVAKREALKGVGGVMATCGDTGCVPSSEFCERRSVDGPHRPERCRVSRCAQAVHRCRGVSAATSQAVHLGERPSCRQRSVAAPTAMSKSRVSLCGAEQGARRLRTPITSWWRAAW